MQILLGIKISSLMQIPDYSQAQFPRLDFNFILPKNDKRKETDDHQAKDGILKAAAKLCIVVELLVVLHAGVVLSLRHFGTDTSGVSKSTTGSRPGVLGKRLVGWLSWEGALAFCRLHLTIRCRISDGIDIRNLFLIPWNQPAVKSTFHHEERPLKDTYSARVLSVVAAANDTCFLDPPIDKAIIYRIRVGTCICPCRVRNKSAR